MLYELIISAQSFDHGSMLELIQKFAPLLRKYAAKLKTEDSYEDLVSDFIEIVHKIKLDNLLHTADGAIVNYLKMSISRAYIRRSKVIRGLPGEMKFSELSETMMRDVEAWSAECDVYFADEFPIPKTLTSSERELLYMIYVEDMTVADVARRRRVSRQTVHKMKKSALEKFRSYLCAAA